ncbi:MAG: hypothetical protein ABH969_10625, partial [Pseudomonadota bacterium]
GVSNLRRPDAPEQLSLFHSHQKKGERSTAAVDRIWEKFGPHAIQRASLLEKKKDEERGG